MFLKGVKVKQQKNVKVSLGLSVYYTCFMMVKRLKKGKKENKKQGDDVVFGLMCLCLLFTLHIRDNIE